jgi:hypothetical protein
VLEVPNSALGPKRMGLWHRTVDGASGKWIQADRGALPSQSVFLTGEKKGDYMAAESAVDAHFVAVFAHSLEHTGGYTPAEATRVAGALLPDILFYDPTRPVSYPVFTWSRRITPASGTTIGPTPTKIRVHVRSHR